MIREREFAKVIENDKTVDTSIDLNYKTIEVEASYDGPKLNEEDAVTPEWV